MARGKNAEAESVSYRATDSDYGLSEDLPYKVKDSLEDLLAGRSEGEYPSFLDRDDASLIEKLVDKNTGEFDPEVAKALKERVEDALGSERDQAYLAHVLGVGADRLHESSMGAPVDGHMVSDREVSDIGGLVEYARHVERDAVHEALLLDEVGRLVGSDVLLSDGDREHLMDRASSLSWNHGDLPVSGVTGLDGLPAFTEYAVGFEQDDYGNVYAEFGYSLRHGGIQDYFDVKGYVTTDVSNVIGRDGGYREAYVVGRDDGDGGVQYGVLVLDPGEFQSVMREMVQGADELGEIVRHLDYSGEVPAPREVVETLDDNFPVEWVSRDGLRGIGTAGWGPDSYYDDPTAREAYEAALGNLVDRRNDLSIDDLRNRAAGYNGVSGSVVSAA